MFNTGLEKLKYADVDTFTWDRGIKRESLSGDARKDFLETRKRVYECQKWHSDVWDEEVTYYPGHGVTTPGQVREFVDNVNINHKNAYIFADMLVKHKEDVRYNLKNYLREHMKYAD